MSRAKSHRLLIKLYEAPHPKLAQAEYACSHIAKLLPELKKDPGVLVFAGAPDSPRYALRIVKNGKARRSPFTIESAGKFNNVLVCTSCRKKSANLKKVYGSDKYLFVAYEKSGPGGPPKPPLPILYKGAKAGK